MNWFSKIDGFDMGPQINPATSLPMLDGIGGVDVGGNPFGIDWSSHLGIESGSPFDPFGPAVVRAAQGSVLVDFPGIESHPRKPRSSTAEWAARRHPCRLIRHSFSREQP